LLAVGISPHIILGYTGAPNNMGGYVEAQDIRLEEMATFGTNISGFFDWTNVSTYIHNVAVQTAQIANLAVNTLKIAGNAVAFMVTSAFSGSNYSDGSWRSIGSIYVDMTGGTVNSKLLLLLSCTHGTYSYSTTYPQVRVVASGGAIYYCAIIGQSSGVYESLMVSFNTNSAQTYTVQLSTNSYDSGAPDYHTYSGSIIAFGAKSSV
jgi:hypothetical protein